MKGLKAICCHSRFLGSVAPGACITSQWNSDCSTAPGCAPASSGTWIPSQQETNYRAARHRTGAVCLFKNLAPSTEPCPVEEPYSQTAPHDTVKEDIPEFGSETPTLLPRGVLCSGQVQRSCIRSVVVSFEDSRRKMRLSSLIDIPLHIFHRLHSRTFFSEQFWQSILYWLVSEAAKVAILSGESFVRFSTD